MSDFETCKKFPLTLSDRNRIAEMLGELGCDDLAESEAWGIFTTIDLENLLNTANYYAEKAQVQPCPECNGEGGEMINTEACREYSECWFCDDQFEMTKEAIESRKYFFNQEGAWYEALSEVESLKCEIESLKRKFSEQSTRAELAEDALNGCSVGCNSLQDYEAAIKEAFEGGER